MRRKLVCWICIAMIMIYVGDTVYRYNSIDNKIEVEAQLIEPICKVENNYIPYYDDAYHRSYSQNDLYDYEWSGIYEFNVKGEVVRFTGGSRYSSRELVSEEVTVYCNKENPSEFIEEIHIKGMFFYVMIFVLLLIGALLPM